MQKQTAKVADQTSLLPLVISYHQSFPTIQAHLWGLGMV